LSRDLHPATPNRRHIRVLVFPKRQETPGPDRISTSLLGLIRYRLAKEGGQSVHPGLGYSIPGRLGRGAPKPAWPSILAMVCATIPVRIARNTRGSGSTTPSPCVSGLSAGGCGKIVAANARKVKQTRRRPREGQLAHPLFEIAAEAKPRAAPCEASRAKIWRSAEPSFEASKLSGGPFPPATSGFLRMSGWVRKEPGLREARRAGKDRNGEDLWPRASGKRSRHDPGRFRA